MLKNMYEKEELVDEIKKIENRIFDIERDLGYLKEELSHKQSRLKELMSENYVLRKVTCYYTIPENTKFDSEVFFRPRNKNVNILGFYDEETKLSLYELDSVEKSDNISVVENHFDILSNQYFRENFKKRNKITLPMDNFPSVEINGKEEGQFFLYAVDENIWFQCFEVTDSSWITAVGYNKDCCSLMIEITNDNKKPKHYIYSDVNEQVFIEMLSEHTSDVYRREVKNVYADSHIANNVFVYER